MINLLIADDNLNYVVSLVNTLNKRNDEIKVIGIAKNGKEAIEIINKIDNIDIILLDLKMPYYSGKEVLNKIEDKKKYEKAFIILSGDSEMLKDLTTNEMINTIIYKAEDLNATVEKINEAFKNKEDLKKQKYLKNKIIKEVAYLGYNISYQGTQYLIDCIEIIAQRYEWNICNLEKDVYPIISKKYQKSIHNIKCSICRATDNMYFDCEINKLKKYFCLSTDTKPKVKTVINTIIRKISN